ncbi:hypothetical protein YC2023_017319 [Brassica napus]
MSRDKYFSTKKSRLYILTQESLLEWRLPEEKAGEVMYDQILFNQEKGRGFRLHGGGGGSSSRDDYDKDRLLLTADWVYECVSQVRWTTNSLKLEGNRFFRGSKKAKLLRDGEESDAFPTKLLCSSGDAIGCGNDVVASGREVPDVADTTEDLLEQTSKVDKQNEYGGCVVKLMGTRNPPGDTYGNFSETQTESQVI